MKLNDLLRALESVESGLYKKDVVEQGTYFAFRKGEVFTFNEEVMCRCRSSLPNDFEGAVLASKLLEMLRKLPDDDITVSVDKGDLVVKGKNRTSRHLYEKEISLQFDVVEEPKDWLALHKDFLEAVSIVQNCASQKQQIFETTCVHIHPKWIEACDGIQLCRWTMKTKVSKSTLVRQSSIKCITQLGVSEFSETENWLHFRNDTGLVISLRKWLEDYRDLSPYLEVSGEPASLPKGLSEDAERAEVFSSEQKDNNKIVVELSPGKVKVVGLGLNGRYSAVKKATYSGEPRTFRIAPKLLAEVVERHSQVEISSDKLKAVVEGKFVYVVSLGKVDSSNGNIKTTGDKKKKVKKREEVGA